MPNRIASILLLLLTIPLASYGGAELSSNGKVRLLQKYNFQKGNHAVVGLVLENEGHELQRALGNFYTDDPEVLDELKREWVTDNPSPVFACGYHYTVHVVNDGNDLESFEINLDKGCNTVATDHGHFFFDPQKLGAFIGKLKKPLVKRERFASVEEARSYMRSLPKDGLLMVITPDWLQYDGEFRFDVECDFGNFDSDRIQECITQTKEKISAKYPDEDFVVEESGSSRGKILVRMKCSKAFYAKFDLYKVIWKWSEYYPTLITIWKAGHESSYLYDRLTKR